MNWLRRLLARVRSVLPNGIRAFYAAAGVAIVVLTVLSLTSLSTDRVEKPENGEIPFNYTGTWNLFELQRHIEAGDVVTIGVYSPVDRDSGEPIPDTAEIVVETTEGQRVLVESRVHPEDALQSLASAGYEDLMTAEAINTVPNPISVRNVAAQQTWLTLLGYVFMAVIFVAIIRLFLEATSKIGSGGFDESKAPARGAITFDDVAGCEEAKYELREVIDFLKRPADFARAGAQIPHGVLLWGPPGTGKTLLARAVANEAGVPFFHASASNFVEMFVGRGAARVRDIFKAARAKGHAVIFIDEFDALAKARGTQSSHDEREQTLNELLVQLDGFSTTDGVVVIAATNRIEDLDPAVLRPGRFTRKVNVPLPDKEGRLAILEVHAKGKPLAESVDLRIWADMSAGMSGAQLADMLNEAAIFAVREGAAEISAHHMRAGFLKTNLGTSRQRSMSLKERAIIAAHETGHAICGRAHSAMTRVEEISLYAHGEALGVTVAAPVDDNNLPSERDCRAQLVSLMGGRAAEQLLFRSVTGGAGNDFEKATELATRMVTKWGMGRDPQATETGVSGRGLLSFMSYARPEDAPPAVRDAAGRAIAAILDEAMVEAKRTLAAELPLLRKVGAYLVEHERMDGSTFIAIAEGEVEVPNADDEWRPTATDPVPWDEISAG